MYNLYSNFANIPIMPFIAIFPLLTLVGQGACIAFNCHISLASFIQKLLLSLSFLTLIFFKSYMPIILQNVSQFGFV